MTTADQRRQTEGVASNGDPLDLLIVGAGFAGMYMLIKARRMGLDALAIEAAPSVGGTWYRNRYPGARVDIQSLEYSYSFDEALQLEWRWNERYASQPELLRYANHVADRFALRKDILFGTRLTEASWDEAGGRWQATAHDRPAMVCTIPRDGDRAAIDAQHAGVRWPRYVRRRDLPHCGLAR